MVGITLPHQIYEQELHEIIRTNLKRPLEEYEIIYSSGSVKGDNYVGIVYRVQVKEKENGAAALNLILKLPPTNEVRRAEFTINSLFRREASFYEDVYPIFKKFQEEKGIDVEKDGFYQVPFCYKALTDEPNEGLFLEDLKILKFEMFDRLKEVTKDQVFLVMRTLAKMHAIGYAMKDQQPKILEPYYEMKDVWQELTERENSSMVSWFNQMKIQALEVIEKSSNKEMIQKIEKLVDKSFHELISYCNNREHTEPYATICHGDCWNNNMLFRYDENGVPIDIRLLDFQIMRYSSPVTDLLYYIFCCTTKNLRDKYYQEFLDVYYEELSTFMKRLGSDPEKVFPRKALNDHLKKFGYMGLLLAIIVIPIFTSDADDIPEMDDMADALKKLGKDGHADEKNLKFTTEKTYDAYAERMSGVCEDMLSLGYL